MIRLFAFQHDDIAQDKAIQTGHQKYPQPEQPVSLKCDAALGCGTPESRSYKARLRAAESRTRERFDRGRRTHALKSSEQKQPRSLIVDDTDQEEDYESDNENETNNETEEDEIVYRVCQYSTGSRYGYLIDHCPEPQQSIPPRPQFMSRARQVHSHPTKPPSVHVDLTVGTITLALVLLLLVAIMLVEIVDIVSNARETSFSESGRRGRSRTRRVLARAFGAPRNLSVDDAEKEPLGLGVTLER